MCQGGRENVHFHQAQLILICSRLMQVSSASLCCRMQCCFGGRKKTYKQKNHLCKWNSQTLSSFTFDRHNDSCQTTKMQLPLSKNISILPQKGLICVNNILNDNTDIFRKSQEPAALCFYLFIYFLN